MAKRFEKKKLNKKELKDTEKKAGVVRKAVCALGTGAAAGLGVAAKKFGPVARNAAKTVIKL